MSAENKALAEDLFVNILPKGQVDRLRELVADDWLDHSDEDGYVHHGEWFMGLWAGDLSIQVTDMLAEGDRVVAYWTFAGTTAVETDEASAGAKVRGTCISRFRDGKLVEYQVARTGTEITS